jgi:type IV pilus assembly protein PilA
MFKVSKGSAGFTLIELLIVVAIIGILAAVAIPAYTGYTEKAKMSGVVNAMGAVKTAVASIYTQNGGSWTTPTDVACTGVAACNTALGIVISQTHIGNIVVSDADGSITVTLDNTVGGDVNGDNLVLSTTDNGVTWVWTNSTVPKAFIPTAS